MRWMILLLAVMPLMAEAQATRDSVIAVTASRTTRIVADRATMYLVIEGSAETAPDAVTRVETKVKAVSDAIKSLGSRVEADRPISYAVGPTPPPSGYPQMGTPSTNLARALIRVHTNRPDQVAHVIGVALAAGAANTSSLTFESSVTDSVRRARITDVLASARADAEALAQSLGGRLGALVDASTSGANFGFQGQSTLNFDNRFGQQAATPDITVNTSVTVRYRLIR